MREPAGSGADHRRSWKVPEGVTELQLTRITEQGSGNFPGTDNSSRKLQDGPSLSVPGQNLPESHRNLPDLLFHPQLLQIRVFSRYTRSKSGFFPGSTQSELGFSPIYAVRIRFPPRSMRSDADFFRSTWSKLGFFFPPALHGPIWLFFPDLNGQNRIFFFLGLHGPIQIFFSPLGLCGQNPDSAPFPRSTR